MKVNEQTENQERRCKATRHGAGGSHHATRTACPH